MTTCKQMQGRRLQGGLPSPPFCLQVTCAAWFPDGKSLVTGSHDKQL